LHDIFFRVDNGNAMFDGEVELFEEHEMDDDFNDEIGPEED
jgi:hypothetical protein